MDRLPRRLLHLEGLAVLAVAVALYADAGFGWLLLLVLFLAPDLSMLGYLGGPRLGSLTYDVVHTYVGPVALGAIGVVGGYETAVQVALIWLAHIGLDRALGYGLKYPTASRTRTSSGSDPTGDDASYGKRRRSPNAEPGSMSSFRRARARPTRPAEAGRTA